MMNSHLQGEFEEKLISGALLTPSLGGVQLSVYRSPLRNGTSCDSAAPGHYKSRVNFISLRLTHPRVDGSQKKTHKSTNCIILEHKLL